MAINLVPDSDRWSSRWSSTATQFYTKTNIHENPEKKLGSYKEQKQQTANSKRRRQRSMSELQSIERKGILVVHRRYGFAN